MREINVGILGATGIVGQSFVFLLSRHPYFRIKKLIASGKRDGMLYGDTVKWMLPVNYTEEVNKIRLYSIDRFMKENDRPEDVRILFSALPAEVAREVEPILRERGFYIFSNASAMRYEEDVPILIPEANADDIKMIERQGYPDKGFVVTNANCSTTGLAVALAPLRKFGIREVFISTYQSISGAGYPGLSALDIMNNVLPFINGEEEKIIKETKKILSIDPEIFPYCIRVPVDFGHLEVVWVKFDNDVDVEDVIHQWDELKGEKFDIPTMPRKPIQYLDDEMMPQPMLAFKGEIPGMVVFTGRVKKENDRVGFVLLVNNIVKGAAGGSIQNAEIFVKNFWG